jgi:hypothetical protein
MRNAFFASVVVAIGVLAVATAAVSAVGPPQGTQSDNAFAGSYAAKGVTSTVPTEQQTSCYAPELTYFGALSALQGYPDGGMSACDGAATTGESLGPYPTQDVANVPMRVKDHSESDIRVDPSDPLHLIGQSKWFVSAEGYNHLLGFYESWDGGQTWSEQGHVPGYEGWTDNTDPVGAFDPYGNFYSLVLPYNFYYDKFGFHKYDNGTNQTNPTVPPEAIAVAVHPYGTGVNDWITTLPNGQPDYLMTAKNANTSDPDKQWITIDDNPASPHYGRIYAMWTLFVYNPSAVFVSYADARPDGTHTPWSTPQILPTIVGKPWDSYLLPHVAPDGTVYTSVTNNPSKQSFSTATITVVSSKDGGATWEGPLPVTSQTINVPTYQNTSFREGIVNTFAVGVKKDTQGFYPLYVSYEDGSTGLSNVYLTGSFDGGQTWTTPIQVNDNAGPTEALQPNLNVAPDGTVSVAFYDRRLSCPAAGTAEATAAGLGFDPLQPYGAQNYCINTAIQFYTWNLTPIGHNVRLSAHTWDPQLSSPHPYGIADSTTFIGDYFGVDSGGGYTYTSSVTTYGDAGNPFFHQQQLVSKIATP